MTLLAICPECGAIYNTEGPFGVLPHVIAFHPESETAQRIMREIAALPLPELSR